MHGCSLAYPLLCLFLFLGFCHHQLKLKEEACTKLEQECEQLRARVTVSERQMTEFRDRSAVQGGDLQKAQQRIKRLEDLLMERNQLHCT